MVLEGLRSSSSMCQSKESNLCIDTLGTLLYPTPFIDPFPPKVAIKAIQMLMQHVSDCGSGPTASALQLKMPELLSATVGKTRNCAHAAIKSFNYNFSLHSTGKQKASQPGAVSNNLWTVDFPLKLHLVVLGWGIGMQEWVKFTEVW